MCLDTALSYLRSSSASRAYVLPESHDVFPIIPLLRLADWPAMLEVTETCHLVMDFCAVHGASPGVAYLVLVDDKS